MSIIGKRIYMGLSDAVPKNLMQKIYLKLSYAGVAEDFNVFLGKRIFLTALIGLIAFISSLYIFSFLKFFYFPTEFSTEYFQIYVLNISNISFIFYSTLIAFFSMISTALIYYFNIYYAVERRTNYVESILPDFLQLVSSNINAGMSPFNAFRSSARKEFGPLSNEVKIASVKALGTESFSNALTELNKRFDSKALKESISFFAQSISSGGKLSKLLEMTSNDLRQTQEMKKELETSSKLFVLFIGFVVLIGTPMLLSISIQFLELINSIQADTVMPAGNTASLGFLTAELAITPDFMVFISLILLLGNSFLASMFIGVLSSGKPKSGVKYFPLLLIVSVIFFFLARTFLTVFLG